MVRVRLLRFEPYQRGYIAYQFFEKTVDTLAQTQDLTRTLTQSANVYGWFSSSRTQLCSLKSGTLYCCVTHVGWLEDSFGLCFPRREERQQTMGKAQIF